MTSLRYALENWNIHTNATKLTEYTFLKACELFAHQELEKAGKAASNPEYNKALRQFVDAVRQLRRFY